MKIKSHGRPLEVLSKERMQTLTGGIARKKLVVMVNGVVYVFWV
jgi:hypothetical protein